MIDTRFSEALDRMHGLGQKVTRTGWHRKDMCLVLIDPQRHINEPEIYLPGEEENSVTLNPFIAILIPEEDSTFRTATAWTASQADLLARDWEVVP